MAASLTYWTPQEAADELRISVSTVYRLIEARKIPVLRVGSQWRIPAADATRAAADSRPSPYQWMRDLENRRDARRRP